MENILLIANERLAGPAYHNGRWYVIVEYKSLDGLKNTELSFDSKEKAERVKKGYRFYPQED